SLAGCTFSRPRRRAQKNQVFGKLGTRYSPLATRGFRVPSTEYRVPITTDDQSVTWRHRTALLDFHFRADFLELLLDGRRLVLVHACLDGFRRAFDEVLRSLQAEGRDPADDLDDVDLVAPHFSERHSEFGLLSPRRRTAARRGAAARRHGHRHGCRCRDAE